MSEIQPDFSLENISAKRRDGKPALLLVKHFQISEANYMKPPLEEQLIDPDGSIPLQSSLKSICSCNSVCVCVPVSSCACNAVCACNTVSSTYKVSATTSRTSKTTTNSITHPKIGNSFSDGADLGGTEEFTSSKSKSKSRSSRTTRTTTTTRTTGGGGGGYYAPCF